MTSGCIRVIAAFRAEHAKNESGTQEQKGTADKGLLLTPEALKFCSSLKRWILQLTRVSRARV